MGIQRDTFANPSGSQRPLACHVGMKWEACIAHNHHHGLLVLDPTITGRSNHHLNHFPLTCVRPPPTSHHFSSLCPYTLGTYQLTSEGIQ